MNCINHPTVAAVAQCADCSKGLCPDCANTYKLILCTPCYNQRKKADIMQQYLSSCIIYRSVYCRLQTEFYGI